MLINGKRADVSKIDCKSTLIRILILFVVSACAVSYRRWLGAKLLQTLDVIVHITSLRCIQHILWAVWCAVCVCMFGPSAHRKSNPDTLILTFFVNQVYMNKSAHDTYTHTDTHTAGTPLNKVIKIRHIVSETRREK